MQKKNLWNFSNNWLIFLHKVTRHIILRRVYLIHYHLMYTGLIIEYYPWNAPKGTGFILKNNFITEIYKHNNRKGHFHLFISKGNEGFNINLFSFVTSVSFTNLNRKRFWNKRNTSWGNLQFLDESKNSGSLHILIYFEFLIILFIHMWHNYQKAVNELSYLIWSLFSYWISPFFF